MIKKYIIQTILKMIFFKEENIKYRYTDISINEINNFFLESLNAQFIGKRAEIKNSIFYK